MKRILGYAAALGLLSGVALAQRGRLSPELERRAPDEIVNVIVQFRQPPTVAEHNRVLRGGGSMRTELAAIRGAAYSVPASSLAELANDPDVVYISPDRKVHGALDLTTAAVNAAAAWHAGYTGAGIGVAVLDSGISSHDDLMLHSRRIVYNQDFVGGGTADYFGHGEHVAGIIAGDGTDSSCAPGGEGQNCMRTFKGIAPEAHVLNLRVLDKNGEGTDSGVILAITTAILLKPLYNIRVLNLSLGRPVSETYRLDPLCIAAEAAGKAGIVVVVAAGNDGRDNTSGINGYGTINSPGNDPDVITVGAMKTMGTPQRTDDLIASYSSKGPTMIDHIVKPDIVAPGNLVVSLLSSTSQMLTLYPQDAVPLSYYEATTQNTASTKYLMLSGTSMATPVVSGAAAVLWQAHPSLSPDQVKARLMLRHTSSSRSRARPSTR